MFRFPLVFVLAVLATAPLTADTRRPNVIVVMADDLGYGDPSCYGATRIRTPNIDRLAATGRRFTAGYSSGSTCTPTRYSLMTGTYAFRTPNTGIAPPNAPAVIPPGTTTLPAILKKAGYTTAVVGKWHLGFGVGQPNWNGELTPGPLDIGFDHCFVLPTTNDRVPSVIVEDRRVKNLDLKDPLWVGDQKPSPDHPTGETHRDTLKMDWSHGHNMTIHNGIGRIGFFTGGTTARFRDEDLADTWIGEATKWITANKDRPFFLYYASHDLHVPRMPHERFQKKSVMGFRGDAILELDWQVGELLDTLDRLKLTDDTLIVFCSDNGPVLDDGYKDGAVEKLGDHKPAGPFRGTKGGVFEGGTRTPFVVRWPTRVTPAVSDQVVCTIDLAASLAALAKQPVPAGACPDSVNVLGALLGEPNALGRKELVQQDNGGRNLGFRQGNWKLIRRMGPPGGKAVADQLYDLATDPGETTNLAAREPAVLRSLGERLTAIQTAGQPK